MAFLCVWVFVAIIGLHNGNIDRVRKIDNYYVAVHCNQSCVIVNSGEMILLKINFRLFIPQTHSVKFVEVETCKIDLYFYFSISYNV